mmetsp:Transcript_52553/g.170759  ORF Transcript_52553/g.170759 Transcript_52553/m.170759 type:complete len:386 (-) Transcript_52553:338-1495(-)
MRAENLHVEVPRQADDDLVGHRGEIPHLLDPSLVHEVRELPLQLRRHLINDLVLSATSLHLARLVEVPPQFDAHRVRHLPVSHQPVQVVHGPLEGRLVGLHRRDNAADGSDDVGPNAGHDGGATRRNAILELCLRSDVAVADACQSDDRPIQRNHVHTAGALVPFGRSTLGLPECLEPSAVSFPVYCQAAPQASHPMAAHSHHDEEFDQGQCGVAVPPGRVPTLQQAREAGQTQQAHQPQKPKHLEVPRAQHSNLRAAVVPQHPANVDGQDAEAEEVNPKPALQILPHDPPWGSHQVRGPRRIGVRDEELKQHIDEEQRVDDPIDDKERIHARLQEGGLEGSSQRCECEKNGNDNVPALQEPRSCRVDDRAAPAEQAERPPARLG